MPTLLRKVIARRGVVVPKNPLGKRTVKVIDDDWIKSVVAAGNQMLKDGLLIPAPYGHTDDNHTRPIPLMRGQNGALVDAETGDMPRWDHAINSGFWQKFEISKGPTPDNPEEEAGDAVGILEVAAGHEDKIGETHRQTSPFVSDWIDGSGKKRINAPLHICITNRAVQNAQPNFRKVGNQVADKSGLVNPELAIAMSFDDGDYVYYEGDLNDYASPSNKPPISNSGKGASSKPAGSGSSASASQSAPDSSAADPDNQLSKGASDSAGESDGDDAGDEDSGNVACTLDPQVVQNIVNLFGDKLGITFPENTTPQNFQDRLLTILSSLDSEEEEEETSEAIEKPPQGSEALQAPTIMSLDPNAGGSNPDDLVLLQNSNKTLLGVTAGLLKANYRSRLDAAIKSGRIGKKRAAWMQAKIDAMELSLDALTEFDPAKQQLPETAIEMDLSDIEEGDPLIGSGNGFRAPQHGYVPNDADDMGSGGEAEPTEDEVNAVLNQSLPSFGYRVGTAAR